MKITVAENAGFCFGVKRAVELALSCKSPGAPVYTLGELIHNPSVVEELISKDILPIDPKKIEELPRGSLLIIRSHGAGPEVFAKCKDVGIVIKDATCPFVKRIHEIVRIAVKKGDRIFIAGEPEHPEVEGIRGWAGTGAVILKDAAAADALEKSASPGCLVAQTTLQREQFNEIREALQDKCENLTVHDTICDTTSSRQQEAKKLAQESTVVIVVGGHNSSNTQKLAQVCKQSCENTYTVQNPSQLLLDNIHSNDIISVVAGASTPQWMIREVVTVMNELEKTLADSTEVEAPKAQEQSPPEGEPEASQPETEQMPVPQDNPVNTEDSAAVDEPKQEEAKQVHETADSSGDSFAEALKKTMVRIRNGQIIKGSVVQIADGEVCVNIGYKSDGFIPKNEFSSDPDANPEDMLKIGDPIEVEVIKVNDGEGNVLLSRKSVESKRLWDELMEEALNEEKVFEGVGKEVVKGGLIASIKGVRAFVPASHVSTKYVENLSDFVGQQLKLSVIEVDKSRRRIVASQKNVLLAELENEKKQKWGSLEIGSKLSGTVRRITDFGAFVGIGGIDGLVHVTDIAWGRVKHPSDILKIGQQIEVLVLNVDAEKERVSLGYKQLQPKPWTLAGEKYPVGSVVEGKVVRIVPFGAFVALEPTIDGLIHISQVSVHRIAKVEDEINIGDIVRCKVLDVNPEAKRISLSRKEVILQENPEIAEQLAAERAERDRVFSERQEQRAAERQQREQQRASARTERTSMQKPVRNLSSGSFVSETPERERRPRRSEDGDYELPPVQSTTTSLADVLQGLNLASAQTQPHLEEPAAEVSGEPEVTAAEQSQENE